MCRLAARPLSGPTGPWSNRRMAEASGSGDGKRVRRRWFKLAALGATTLVGLAVAEVALRVKELERKEALDRDAWHVFDRELGWRARASWSGEGATPGTEPVTFSVRTNARGLRMDRPVPDAPPPGGRRVCFVGDSFVFGYGCEVEDGVCARLDAALGPEVEVVNLGTCAYGLGQMRLVVERQALPLAPDLILVGVIDQNFRRALRPVSHTGHQKPRYVLDGDGVRLTGVPLPDPPAEGEYFYGDHPPGGGSFLAWKLGVLVDRAGVALAGGDEGARRRWRLGAALLADAHRVAGAAGVPLAVVHFPTRDGLAEGDPLRPLLEALEVPVLDGYPAFAGGDPAELYLPDGHPSPAGHARLADAIAAFVRERLPG